MSDDEKTYKREGQIKGYGTAVPVPKTFRAIDALFAEPVEYAREALQTYFDRKKVENLVAHAQAVRQANKDRTPPTGNPSIHQLELLDQWAQKAASFGDESPELAAAWRAVLEKIQLNDPDAEDILLALRSLTSSDVYFFTEQFKRKVTNEKSTFSTMVSNIYVYTIYDKQRLIRLLNIGLISYNIHISSVLRSFAIFLIGLLVAVLLAIILIPHCPETLCWITKLS